MGLTERISGYTATATTHPIQLEDLMDFSNYAGAGPVFDVSKQVKMSELIAFLAIHLGVSIPNDIIPIGNAAGDGIEASTGKAGGVAGFLNDFVLAHKDFFNDTEYMAWQDEFGATYYSTGVGAMASYYVGSDLKMTMGDEGVVISAISGQNVSIGVVSLVSGAKFQVRGEGNTNATSSASFRNIDNNIALLIDDGGFITLLNGTSVNEITTGGDYSAATDDQLPTRLDVKTYKEAVTVEEDLTTSYLLTDADHGKIIELDNAAAITLTLNTGLRSDFACTYVQKGVGQVTISGTATINEPDGFMVTEKQHVAISIIPSTTADNYTIAGRLVP